MHSVAVDFFETEIDGIITSVTVQDIIDATILGPNILGSINWSGCVLY